MAHRSPKSKRIPEVKATCFVENAIAPPLHDGYRVCIAHPVAGGLQPALIVPPAGQVIDTLAIIPEDIRHSPPHTGNLYGNYLGLIQYAQRKNIERIGNNNFVMLWQGASRTEPPFRYVTLPRLTKELEPLLRAASNTMTRQKALVELRTAWARSFQSVIPHVLDRALRRQERWKKHWWILDHWARWEERELDLYARFLAHRHVFPGEQINDENYTRLMNTFTKFCGGTLRLPLGKACRTSKKTARRRRLELKAERQLRDIPQ